MNRRVFLKLTGLTGLGFYVGELLPLTGCSGTLYLEGSLDPTDPNSFTRPLALPGQDGLLGFLTPSAPLEASATEASVTLMEGHSTQVWAYAVNTNGRSYLNPTFYVRQGDTFDLTLINALGSPTIIHWHGLDVDWQQDGNPSYAVASGERYAYRLTVKNRGGTYWYHPHPHQALAEQAYRGLAGLMLVEDDDELALRAALDLSPGTTDIPLLLQDKRLDTDMQLAYSPSGMESFDGYLGNLALVNLTINPKLDVSTRLYRFRLLNGANARILRLAFTQNDETLPFLIIGTDGGLLEKAQEAEEVFLSPGERVDVLLDLSTHAVGDVLFLRTLAFEPMDTMHMGMREASTSPSATQPGQSSPATSTPQQETSARTSTSSSSIAQGSPFYLLKLTVTEAIAYSKTAPDVLSSIDRIDTSGATVRPITLSSSPSDMMAFAINGQTYDMNAYPIEVLRGTVEIWEVTNQVGDDISSMPHPLHIHGALFQVQKRSGSPAQILAQGVDEAGRLATDLGWKDTILIWPGETVRLAMDFRDAYPGEQRLLIHCHNLEHEEAGMMINYRISG